MKKNMIKVLGGIALVTAATAASFGCNVQEAKAPRNEVQATIAQQEFPMDDAGLEYKNLSTFFWRLDMGQMDSALASRAADEADLRQRKAFKLKLLLKDAQKVAMPVLTLLAPHEEGKKRAQSKIDSNLKRIEAELKKPTPNQTKIDQWNAEIAQAHQDIKDLDQKMADIIAVPENAQLYQPFAQIRTTLIAVGAEGNAFLRKVQSLTESLTKPALVQVVPVGPGELSVKIEGWKPTVKFDKARNFSTADGNVKNVSYRALGGVVAFDVETTHSEKHPLTGADVEIHHVYRIKFARTSYATGEKLGVKIVTGDMERYVGHESVEFCLQLRRDLLDARIADQGAGRLRELYEPCLYRKGIAKGKDKFEGHEL